MTEAQQQYMHQWLWVIIPHGKFNEPLLSGYCKTCDNVFTLPLQSKTYGLNIYKAGVPKWGCVDPFKP